MRGVLVRVRVYAGQLALLAALALVAALLVTGAPKVVNHLADRALRSDLAATNYPARDLILQYRPEVGELSITTAMDQLDTLRGAFARPLPELVGESWFAGSVDPQRVLTQPPVGPMTKFGLRMQTGVTGAVRLTTGRWPATAAKATAAKATAAQIAVSTDVAKQMGLRVGGVLLLNKTFAVLVVGVFEPVDRSAHIWDDAPQVLTESPGLGDEAPPVAIALTDAGGLSLAEKHLGPLTYQWRYRIDERRLDAGMLDEVVTAVVQTQRLQLLGKVSTSLDKVLARFQEQLRSVRALLAVVQAGLLSTLLGLVVLAARLTVERRRDEFALLRARGSAVLTIGGRTLGEAVVVLPAAVVAGWRLGLLTPGRPPGTGALVAAVGAVIVLAVPVLAMAAHAPSPGRRRLSLSTRRRDLTGTRPSALTDDAGPLHPKWWSARLTAELSVLVLAVLGTVLLRRRGLSQDSGVDPYLVCVPVLLATAAALVALRIVPWPLRQAGRLATRARGAVAFLGLARAGRAPAVVGPLAVVVVAVTTGVFCSVVTSTVDRARDRVAEAQLPADAAVAGFRFTPQTTDRLAALPGVRAVAPLVDFAGTSISEGVRGDFARFVVVDPDALRRVLEGSGVDAALPGVLSSARPGGPVPAVVSPAVAEKFPNGGTANTRVGVFDFTVAAVVDHFPGLGVDTERFVVLPWQALPVSATGPLAPNRFLIAGHGFDVDQMRQTGDAGQQAYAETSSSVLSQPTEVTTRTGLREGMERTGANQVLTFAFVVGTAGAAALALLATGFTVLAEARVRGRTLSRLRTMGLSGRQSRRMLVYELVPLVCVAVLAGAAVGVLLPRLFGPALGLDLFTAGSAATVRLDPSLVAGLLALIAAALASAAVVENVVNRRMRLGEVLRLGEES